MHTSGRPSLSYIFAKHSIYGGNLWKTPDFADEYCKNYSSQVVTIHSEQEQEFVTSHILGFFEIQKYSYKMISAN